MPLAKPYPESEYCTHMSTDGRRCRALKMMTREVCIGHWKRDGDFVDDEEALAQLASRWSAMTTTRGINRALAFLFQLTALGKVSHRRAALLTYQAQLMLQSLRRGRFDSDAVAAESFDAAHFDAAETVSQDAAASVTAPEAPVAPVHPEVVANDRSASSPVGCVSASADAKPASTRAPARDSKHTPARASAPAVADAAVQAAFSRQIVDAMEEVMEPVAAGVKSRSAPNGKNGHHG